MVVAARETSLTTRVYLRPVLAPMCAGAVDLVIRDDERTQSATRLANGDVPAAIGSLPDDLAQAADAQWRGQRSVGRWPGGIASASPNGALPPVAIMGILNITPDSFSDGGAHTSPDAARSHAKAMRAAGAAIIDVGGESTRPNAAMVTADEELRRVRPVIEAIAGDGAAVSVDTRRPEVMAAALSAGAAIINDVSALRHDPRSAEVVARAGCPIVLMHAPGPADDLHAGKGYRDVALDVFDFLRERRDAAIAHGIAADRIILDPGIGFGKSVADNLALLRALPLFRGLGCPLLVGASRKRMIAAIAGDDVVPGQRIGGSLALALAAIDGGASLLRVHDVAETVQAAAVWTASRQSES